MSTIKGKTYGLIIKKKPGSTNIVKKPAIFGDDSSDEDDKGRQTVNKTIRKEAEKNKQIRQTQIEINKVLEDDPTAFEYDKVYDKMTEKKADVLAAKTKEVVKKPKYIGSLLKFAEQRKKEEERRIERQVQKEREQEGSEFADKDSFVTTAYRKKMQALAEDEERQRQLDKLEGDVTKQADLSKFYRNLLDKNVSTGGAYATDIVTKETEENKMAMKEHVVKQESNKKENTSSSGDDKKVPQEERRLKKSKDKERKDSERMGEGNGTEQQHISDENRSKETMRKEGVGNRRLQGTQEGRKNQNRTDDESRSKEQKRNEESDEGLEYTEEDKERRKRSHEDSHEVQRSNNEKEEKRKKENVKSQMVKDGVSKLAKHTNEENVLSARERYLARKKTRVIVQHNSDDEE